MFKAMLIKEFILVLRDRQALAALFIMPAVFILIMSMALKDTMGSGRALISYAVTDEDNSAESAEFKELLGDNTPPAADGTTEGGSLEQNLNFILTIPAGFSRNLAAGEQDGKLLQLTVAADVKEDMLRLFEARLAMIVTRLRLEKMKEELAPFLPEVAKKLEEMDFSGKNLVGIRFSGQAANKKPTATQQSVPAWIVFGMFFVVIPMSTIFINERRQNTLARMSAMNISVPLLFAGKTAPYMVINQIQVWLMIGVGIFIVPLLGGEALTLGASPGGLFMVSLGLSLAAIGTSVLIAVLARTVEQATTIGGIINILLGAIGGVMVPKFVLPPAMRTLAGLSPMSWGMEGFLDIFLRGLGAAAVIKETLALAGFGLGLLLVAALIFSYKLRKGL